MLLGLVVQPSYLGNVNHSSNTASWVGKLRDEKRASKVEEVAGGIFYLLVVEIVGLDS